MQKERRLAITLDYRVCKVTIIFTNCCAKKKVIVTIFIVSVFFHYRGCFFSLSWVFFHNCGCLFIIVGAFSIFHIQ